MVSEAWLPKNIFRFTVAEAQFPFHGFQSIVSVP
jgi:hypothetical protein